ncbi:hypothetical protein EMCRGX_G007798 [Ephydatia muelleri]
MKRTRHHLSKDSFTTVVIMFPLSTIGKLLMQPLAASQQHKSDVALIMNGLPVIQFEINSSPISTTVAKLFANLVDVLRFIRHFDLKINTWTGFAFPKVKVDSSNNYAFKVGVRWKNLQFAPEVSALKLRDIAQEVKDTFNMQVDLVQKLYVSEDEAIAKTCLGELANGIANGLKTLHDLGYAHLDVRLPNVCVSADFEVKLIDFDRATCVKSYKNTNFFMYTLEKEDQQELKRQDIPINRESFLGKLIWEHEYDQNAMQLWISKLLPTQNMSLRNVFEVL